MSLREMLTYIDNNDLASLENTMQSSDTHLTDKICTHLLIFSLEKKYIKIANYILKFEFDIDSDVFEKYLDKGLMDRAIHGNLKEGKHNASFLFTDLRGYTKLLADPQMTKMLLDPYFAIVTNVVHYYNGIVSQFVGDSVESMFNVPKKQPDHILAAVTAGLKIKKEIERFNSSRPRDFPAIRCGIGIDEGEIYLSLVGGDVKRYQPLGEAVIVANDLSKHSSNRVIVSKRVYDKVKDKVMAKSARTIVVKGKTLEIYEVEGQYFLKNPYEYQIHV